MPSIPPQWMYAEYIKFYIVASGSELSAAIFLLITSAKNLVWNCGLDMSSILTKTV